LAAVTSPAVVASKEYQALAALESEKGKIIMSELAGGSIRMYTLLRTIPHPDTDAATLPGKFVLAVSVEVSPENEDDFNKWYTHRYYSSSPPD
jgi:hypothetical protein